MCTPPPQIDLIVELNWINTMQTTDDNNIVAQLEQFDEVLSRAIDDILCSPQPPPRFLPPSPRTDPFKRYSFQLPNSFDPSESTDASDEENGSEFDEDMFLPNVADDCCVNEEEQKNNQTGSNGKSTQYNDFNIILLTFLTPPRFVIISPSFT